MWCKCVNAWYGLIEIPAGIAVVAFIIEASSDVSLEPWIQLVLPVQFDKQQHGLVKFTALEIVESHAKFVFIAQVGLHARNAAVFGHDACGKEQRACCKNPGVMSVGQ